MVEIDIEDIPVIAPAEEFSSREERKRTGRYVAAGTAIFLSILGVYQALIRGTPEYAALFAPAVIMFMYVLWILHTSRHQNARRLLRLKQAASSTQLIEEIITETSNPPEKADDTTEEYDNVETLLPNETNFDNNVNSKRHYYNRSYSIA